MVFSIVTMQNLEVKQPVKFTFDGNTHEFTGKFKLLDDNSNEQLANGGDHDFIKKILVGWGDDFVGEDDKPLPFNAENLAACLKISWWRTAVIDAYFVAVATAGRKNY